jgi:hypothetical protein
VGEYVDFRHLMKLMEFEETEPASQPAEPVVENPNVEEVVIEKLNETIFKLRAYSSPSEGDFGLGEEAGCEIAAGILESLMRQLGEQVK